MDHPYAVNELILMLGLVASKFGNERSLPKALDSEDGPAHPNIIYEEPDDKASSSDKDVSDATLPAIKTLSIYLFFGGFGALRSTAQMVPYEVSIGIILIVRLVSAFGSAKEIARMFP
uniref:Uncharacterized protein n=1 Tax=Lactuca sativa TaxID=4236 RepID=A0A9R1VQ51_LACSA|nr:hypothetical protein LSAT_V11C400182810 [Lactuca sativa]